MILINQQRALTENGLDFFIKTNKEFLSQLKYKVVVESVRLYGKRYYNVKVYQYTK